MSATTLTTCPNWCTRRDVEHYDPNPLSERGLEYYGVEAGTQVTTHTSDIAEVLVGASAAGQRKTHLSLAIEQDEAIRDGVSESRPLTVAFYAADYLTMSPAEARHLAAWLIKAAGEVDQLASAQ